MFADNTKDTINLGKGDVDVTEDAAGNKLSGTNTLKTRNSQ